LLHNMGPPPRTRVGIEVRPVFGAVLVSLPHCLRLNHLIDLNEALNESDFSGLWEATLRWAGDPSQNGLWTRLEAGRCTRDSADVRAVRFGGGCIGWSDEVYPQTGSSWHYPPFDRICLDLDLCLAVLSRRVGNLFLSYRPPDYSREQLLHWAFVADDPRLVAASVACADWGLGDRDRAEHDSGRVAVTLNPPLPRPKRAALAPRTL
jgi:hypothetical protein